MARRKSRRAGRARRADATAQASTSGAEAARRGQAAKKSRLAQIAPFILFGLMLVGRCAPRATPAAGGPGDVQHVVVDLRDAELAPATVAVRAGHPVDVTVHNAGTSTHDWAVEGLDQPVHVAVEPGETGTVRFTPSHTGSYRIAAGEPGRAEADMVGQLVVQ